MLARERASMNLVLKIFSEIVPTSVIEGCEAVFHAMALLLLSVYKALSRLGFMSLV